MQLEFINKDGEKKNLSDADRRTIRSVSRRVGAATRRERGLLARINTLQMPDFLTQQDHTGVALPQPVASRPNLRSPWSGSSPRRLAIQPIERLQPGLIIPSSSPLLASMSVTHDDLSALMKPDIADNILRHAATADVNSNPRRWVKICQLVQASVIQILPQLYGYNTCLNDSVDCLLLRISQLHFPEFEAQSNSTLVDRMYRRAIRSLSSALSSGVVDRTVWYATLLMALFELLDYSSEHAWIMHSRGAFDVLGALGPQSITTEIDKDLLVTQAEIMILESTFANVGIFLDKPGWQNALQSTIVAGPSLVDRSEAVVTFWMMTSRAPGLFQRATNIVMNKIYDERHTVVYKFHELLQEYSNWEARWAPEMRIVVFLERQKGILNDPASTRQMEVLVMYLAYLTLVNRFLSALQPHTALVTEQAAMAVVCRILRFSAFAQLNAVLTLRVRFAVNVARSVQNTTSQWTESASNQSSDVSGIIEPDIFAAWCSTLGRATGEPLSCIELG